MQGCTLRLQSPNFVGAKTGLTQYLFAVLPQAWRWALLGRHGRCREFDRHTDLTYLAFGRVDNGFDHANRLQMRIVDQAVNVLQRHARNISRFKQAQPVGIGLGGHRLTDHGVKLIDVLGARTDAAKAWVLFEEFRLANQA